MDIGVPLRRLGTVDVSAVRERLLAQPEALWHADAALKHEVAPRRPTQHLYLLFTRPQPALEVRRCAGWEPLSAVSDPVVESLLRSYPAGGKILSIMFARLPPRQAIRPHRDIARQLRQAHRLHLPIVTSSHVDFFVDGSGVETIEGEAFELNNQLVHEVHNRGTEARIHLIVDYAPPGAFADSVREVVI